MTKESWGKTAEGQEVDLYRLSNKNGMQAAITNWGATVVSLTAPDRTGKFQDVVLGYDSLDGYLNNKPYFGVVVGRYGNRIAKAKFSLDGKEYTLFKNDGANTLHGGQKGFDKRVWTAKDVSTPDTPKLELTYVSKDGEEGYPGTLTATVTYSLTDKNELRIDYSATTDKDTVLNLTNHSYFNLAGAPDILSHEIMIASDNMTPVDSGLIPTGKLRPVENTPFDFRKPMAIGSRINADDEQLKLGKGYDHNFVLNGSGMRLAARVTDASTGRIMEVDTDQPGVQFYTGNFLDGTAKGKGGKAYGFRSGLCLETQHFPDSPNQPQFPTTVLKPGEKFQSTTVYRFSAK